MNRFRRKSLFMLVVLVGAIMAVACTTEDAALPPTETPGQTFGPTPDVEAIVQRAVRETLETLPTVTPAPTPDIEAIVETAVRETLETAPAVPVPTPDIEEIVEAVVRKALEALTTAVAVRTEASGAAEPAYRGRGQSTTTSYRVHLRHTRGRNVRADFASPTGDRAGRGPSCTGTDIPGDSVFKGGGWQGQRVAQHIGTHRGRGTHGHRQWLGEGSGGRSLRSRDPGAVLRPWRSGTALHRGPRRSGREPHGNWHRGG